MARMQLASACRQVGRLFGQGTVAGLGEGQLLDRFVARRDDAAFEAIVARHGPMVLAVCRSLLRDPNDVDDAFQATFLVLVKRAESVRHRDLLGPWLHGVARRVALRSRAESARRRDRLPLGAEPSGMDTPDLESVDERASIHAEVERLPSSYRAAIVLCYLEGRTHEEAARELGWPVGTVRGRLARARDLLRGRLERRGVGLTSAALLATLARESEAAVPGVLLESTMKAAAVAATGPLATVLATSAIGSARAVALAQGVLPAMTAAKLKLAATLVVVGLLAGPGASAQQGGGDARPRPRAGGVDRRKANPPKVDEAKPTDPADAKAPESPEERLRLAEKALSNRLTLLQEGQVNLTEANIAHWNRLVLTIRLQTGRDPGEALRSYVETSRKVEALARDRARAGQGTEDDVTLAQFDRIEVEDKTRQILGLPPGPIRFPLTAGNKPDGGATANVDPTAKPAIGVQLEVTAGGATERLRIAEEALAVLKKIQDAPNTKSTPGLVSQLNQQVGRWQSVADDARHELGGPDPSYLNALRDFGAKREAEAAARKRLDAGQGSRLEYLNAQLDRVMAQQELEAYPPQGAKKPPAPAEPASKPATPGPDPGPGPKAQGGGDPNVGPMGEPEPPRPRKLPKAHPSDADRDKAIEQALEKTVTLDFPKGTTLDEVLTFVRTHTKDAKANLPKGVPIYVDPIVTFGHSADPKEKDFATIAPIALDDIPLRVALRLVLDQFSLSYQVRDRMVYILDDDLLDYRSEGAAEFHAASGMRVPARGVGMGGMGGMGGGMGGMGGMGGGAGGNQSPQGGGFR